MVHLLFTFLLREHTIIIFSRYGIGQQQLFGQSLVENGTSPVHSKGPCRHIGIQSAKVVLGCSRKVTIFMIALSGNFRFRNLYAIFIVSGLVGLFWGIVRIELVLLVPYFFLVVYLCDLGVYTIYGYWIGKNLRSLSGNKRWALFLPALLMYAGDRFLSAFLILGIPYSGRTNPLWRLLIEITIISLALGASWRGWFIKQHVVGKR